MKFPAIVRILLAGALFAVVLSPSAGAASGPKRGQPAPDFSLPDAEGKTVRLSDFKGKVVVLDFWATWCIPCKTEIPWFIEFQEKYEDSGFSVVGVSLDKKGWKIVRPYTERMKMNYPVLLGNDEMASLYGGLDELPTTYILDREGNIVAKHVGLAGKRKIENQIKSLL